MVIQAETCRIKYQITKRNINLWSMVFFYSNIQGVTGGTDQNSGECSLGHTIPI